MQDRALHLTLIDTGGKCSGRRATGIQPSVGCSIQFGTEVAADRVDLRRQYPRSGRRVEFLGDLLVQQGFSPKSHGLLAIFGGKRHDLAVRFAQRVQDDGWVPTG
ncbi:hypothetical protein AWN90_07475 [Nocardia terpenica]|uniref:Uncharacterized protein n=1 Tax=Nocardia terpenica TaxID=455432 RepID=A0A164INV3_9NOCA|nr:hypothetical protein AWN90_07475 [Nocardia terpenica]